MNIDDQEKLKETPEKDHPLKSQEKKHDESLVLIQFTDLDDAQYCQHFSNKFKTINIEKSSPIIQIGSRFYKGEYTNNIGTYLFFEETQTSQSSSTADSNKPSSGKSANSASNLHSNENNNNNLNNSTSINDNSNSTYFGKSYKKLILTRLFIEEKPHSQH